MCVSATKVLLSSAGREERGARAADSRGGAQQAAGERAGQPRQEDTVAREHDQSPHGRDAAAWRTPSPAQPNGQRGEQVGQQHIVRTLNAFVFPRPCVVFFFSIRIYSFNVCVLFTFLSPWLYFTTRLLYVFFSQNKKPQKYLFKTTIYCVPLNATFFIFFCMCACC